jgi:dihydrofolate synthase/folylpolyglutamate synthase
LSLATQEHLELESVTTFEAMTVLALDHFARRDVDIAILEVGVGGRLDATNVVNADIGIITPISIDHRAILGSTLKAIAREKAGILKPGQVVLSAPQDFQALEVIQKVARDKHAVLGIGGQDWIWMGGHKDLTVAASARNGLWGSNWRYSPVRVPLLGEHQLDNAALAVAAARAVGERLGWQIEYAAVLQGLDSTEWAGRLEILQARDSARPIVIADGAHNGASAEKLMAALNFHFKFDKLYLILGVLGDKELEAIARPFAHQTELAWTVKTKHPRSREATDIASALNALGVKSSSVLSFEQALGYALERASPDDLVLITGSLSIVAQAREAFGLAHLQDPPYS